MFATFLSHSVVFLFFEVNFFLTFIDLRKILYKSTIGGNDQRLPHRRRYQNNMKRCECRL